MKQPVCAQTFQRVTSVSPDPTRQKARHSKWNHSEHLKQRQPVRNVRQTDASKSHCCRTTKSAPIGTSPRSWRPRNDNNNASCTWQATYMTPHEGDCFNRSNTSQCMTTDSELCEALVAHDQVSGAVVNVAPRQTRKRSHNAKPKTQGAHTWSASLRMHAVKRPQFYRAW